MPYPIVICDNPGCIATIFPAQAQGLANCPACGHPLMDTGMNIEDASKEAFILDILVAIRNQIASQA